MRRLRGSKLVSLVKRIPLSVRVAKGALWFAGMLRRPAIVSRYLAANGVRKLQIGADVCALPGWLNTDLYPRTISSATLDATKPFPFPDRSFDYVFSEHQIEHIAYDEGLTMLKECHRILRRGGKLRIATPSLDRMIQLFEGSSAELKHRYAQNATLVRYPAAPRATGCFAVNGIFMNWGHRFIYDQETLRLTLETAGFTRIQFFAPGESDDPSLVGLETRRTETDVYETMVVQAVRA